MALASHDYFSARDTFRAPGTAYKKHNFFITRDHTTNMITSTKPLPWFRVKTFIEYWPPANALHNRRNANPYREIKKTSGSRSINKYSTSSNAFKNYPTLTEQHARFDGLARLPKCAVILPRTQLDESVYIFKTSSRRRTEEKKFISITTITTIFI